MPASIDYYYVGASPFAYLGHDAVRAVADKHGAKLNYRPVNLMAVWEISGAVPPAQRPAVRQRYRLIEMQRIALMRNLAINLKPAHFPVDVTLCDQVAIAISRRGADPHDYIKSVFTGVWVDEQNLADGAVIADKISLAGFDADDLLAEARSPEVAAERVANTNAAIAADAIGAPAYVLNGEAFWGQDRIDYLDLALTSGRKAFTAD